jgi:hypothetical protein
VERTGHVADDEVEMPVAVPVGREGPGADVVDPVIPLAGLALHGDDERLAVGPFQDLRLPEGPALLAI